MFVVPIRPYLPVASWASLGALVLSSVAVKLAALGDKVHRHWR